MNGGTYLQPTGVERQDSTHNASRLGLAGRAQYEERYTADINYGRQMAIFDEAMHVLLHADGSLT